MSIWSSNSTVTPATTPTTPPPERILETIERYEEDLTDLARPHFPIRAIITVGDAIEITAARDRSQDADPITVEIRQRMEELLESSKASRRVMPTGTEIS